MRSPAAIQASLAAGRCAACDAPVPADFQQPRFCLCAACRETLAWCSTCQQPKPREAFYRNAKRPTGVQPVCKACLSTRPPAPPCGRCGEPCAHNGRSSFHRLCAACLVNFAWCHLCKRPRRRSTFVRPRVREHGWPSGECRRCNADAKRTGRREWIAEATKETYRRIADYAMAHPDAQRCDVMRALGVTLYQVCSARERYGFTFRGRPRTKEPRHA
jgi:hypothetical protein